MKRDYMQRNSFSGQFAGRLVEMLRSPAHRALSLSALRVLFRIEVELADHGGKDNGRLPVTYDDFEAWGVHRHAISPAIRELEALGFVEVTQQGVAGNAEFRLPSLYRLTFRPVKRAKETDEWKHITSDEQAEQLARAARATRGSKKQKTSGGKRHGSVPETTTEKGSGPVSKTATTAPVSETTTTFDISGATRTQRMAG